MQYQEFDDLREQMEDEEQVYKGMEKVDEGLWHKIEKVGSKISFVKDVKALFQYMKDPYVQWYRKSIVVAALLYFILPIDTIPDIAPLIGYLDDLGVIMAVVKYLGSELIPYYD
jgi:uncharacterized membrane protein YkvA (DUF1232 family)